MTTGGEQDELSRLLVERLYGELDEEGQRALDARLAADPSARRELERLERTLTITRAALRGPLADPAPARVRGRVLEAARKAAAERRAAAAPGPALRERDAVSVVDRIMAWLRRPWFIPALVGAAAIAVFAVGRETILAPEVKRAFDLQGKAAEAPAPAPPVAPADESKGEESEPAREVPVARARRVEAKPSAPKPARRSVRPPREQEESARDEASDRPGTSLRGAEGILGGVGQSSGGAAPQPSAAPRYAEPPPSWSAGAATSNASAAPAKKAAAPLGRARVPAAESAPAAAPAAAPPPSASADRAERDDEEQDLRNVATDELVTRADRAFDAGRWADARTHYVELLRREPRSPAAPRWRDRVAACNRLLRAR